VESALFRLDNSLYDIRTKTSLGDGVESVFSGAVLAAYNSSTGTLDSYKELPPSSLGETFEMELPKGVSYDFFLIGNLWLIDKESGEKTIPLIPARSEDMRNFSYRIDGKDEEDGGKRRRESFSEVSKYGLPLCWSASSVEIPKDGAVEIRMTRLFSRLNLTIDHSGLTGTSLEDFVNGSVRVRSSNCRLRPFSPSGSKAESPEDVLDIGDYDSVMENALSKTFVFYVPENMNGTLLPDNGNPRDKTPEKVAEVVGEGASKFLTYIEFTGKLTGSGTGLEGDVVYRFFLGKDATKNFDVPRGETIGVSLSFNAESLFSADWKVDGSAAVDGRDFFLSGDLAGKLPDGKMIAVRANRPGTFNLNLCLGENGENIVNKAKLTDPGYEAESLSDFAWTSNILSASGKDENEAARLSLEALGISVSYSEGTFTFAVTDKSLFRKEVEVPVTFTLYPGGKTVSAVIKTMQDLKYYERMNKSFSKDFNVAQKRTLRFNGLAGSKVYYYSDQAHIEGHNYENEHSNNRQWKASNDLSAPFVKCVVDESGEIIPPYKDYSLYEDQTIGPTDPLGVYAFYPNDFKGTTGPYKDTISEGAIMACTDDVHNDGVFSIPLSITMPVLVDDFYNEGRIPLLSVDGKEWYVNNVFRDCYSNASLHYSSFDPVLYDALIKPKVSFSDGDPWMSCVEFAPERSAVYIARTTYTDTDGTVKNIEDLELSTSLYGYYFMGNLSINENLTVYVNFPHGRLLKAYLFQPRMTGGSSSTSNNVSYFNRETETDSVSYCVSDVYLATCDTAYNKVSHRGECFRLSNDESVKPVVHLKNRGGLVRYSFYTEEQPKQIEYVKYEYPDKEESDSVVVREYFPGWMQVPYGEHSFVVSATNRWDGRTIDYVHSFTFNYNLNLGQVMMFRPSYYSGDEARLYMVPKRNAYYLLRYGGESYAYKMMEVLGTNEWMNHLYFQKAFRVSNSKAYQYDFGNTWTRFVFSTHTYDVKTYNSSAAKWTSALAKQNFEDNNATWLSICTLDGGFTSSDSADVTGSKYLSVSVSTERLGYCVQ